MDCFLVFFQFDCRNPYPHPPPYSPSTSPLPTQLPNPHAPPDRPATPCLPPSWLILTPTLLGGGAGRGKYRGREVGGSGVGKVVDGWLWGTGWRDRGETLRPAPACLVIRKLSKNPLSKPN